MPVSIENVVSAINDSPTVLILGSGASIPSGGPSAPELSRLIAKEFKIEEKSNLGLATISSIITRDFSRRKLVELIGVELLKLKPSKGILNLPVFPWKEIYTTNYDLLIERAYGISKKPLKVISSNFGYDQENNPLDTNLFKFHGTLNEDRSLGHQASMILTRADYDTASSFRESLFGKLGEALISSNCLIVGHSLQDDDLNRLIEDALAAKIKSGAAGKITLFLYTKDTDLAYTYEERGIRVCFGGIDELLEKLSQSLSEDQLLPGITDDIASMDRRVVPSTTIVSAQETVSHASPVSMFNGSAGSYSDILTGWTFKRSLSDEIYDYLSSAENRIAYVLGTAGSGKTTLIRSALISITQKGIECWEHNSAHSLNSDAWIKIDTELRKRDQIGVLFIDDAHEHMNDVNNLCSRVSEFENIGLKIIMASAKHHWNPRLKVPAIFKSGKMFTTTKLDPTEIESLLDLVGNNEDIKRLVERKFIGFGRHERKQRLTIRCNSDTFICLRNIFGFEAFDSIILEEYAKLKQDYQEVYKQVSGMQSAGITVHRQFVMRTIGINANQVTRFLEDLDGIISETTINKKEGIYGWNVRHGVIADIISKHKFDNDKEFFELLDKSIGNFNLSYSVEFRSLNQMCDIKNGVGRLANKDMQNILFRKMISLAPKARVPRHRLIHNLIRQGEFDPALSEIKVFENELRIDGPVKRHKVKLILQRVAKTATLMEEDKISLLNRAKRLSNNYVKQSSDDKNMHRLNLEVGVAYFKVSKDDEPFLDALSDAKDAYERILDPDLGAAIRKYEAVAARFHSD